MCLTPKKRMEPPSKSFRSRFCELLKLFLYKMLKYDSGLLPVPPILGDGKSVDLLKLLLVVKENGGYEVVSKNRFWDLVAKEFGYDIKLGPSLKLVYVKYLCTLETWLKRLVEENGSRSGVGDYTCVANGDFIQLMDEFKNFLSLVPNSKELDCKLNKMVTEEREFDGDESCVVDHYESTKNGAFVIDKATTLNNVVDNILMNSFTNGKKTQRVVNWKKSIRRDGDKGKKDDVGNTTNGVRELCSNASTELTSRCKRKHDSMLKMLSWITRVARNPCDPMVVSLPECSKWQSYGNEEPWKRVLLVRENLFLKRNVNQSPEQFNSQKNQKVDPSIYDNEPVGLIQKPKERSKVTKKPRQVEASTSARCFTRPSSLVTQTKSRPLKGGMNNDDSSHRNPGIDIPTNVAVPCGKRFQVEVPEWSGVIDENDLKWMGTRIWPLENEEKKLNFETEEIGKGRQDSCGCQVPNSTECVRLHITENKLKLKNELGIAFSHWQLDKIGEGVALSWTEEDKRKFESIVNSYKHYWPEIVKYFPNKKVKDLVNYLFNVVLLQKRAKQNRFTPEKVFTDSDSDDDDKTTNASAKCRVTVIRSLYSPKKQWMK